MTIHFASTTAMATMAQQAAGGSNAKPLPQLERTSDDSGGDEDKSSGRQCDAQGFDHGSRHDEPTWRRVRPAFDEACTRLALWQKPRWRAEPCGARLHAFLIRRRCKRKDADQRSIADLRAGWDHCTVTDKGATPETSRRQRHPTILDAPGPERCFISDRTTVADFEEVGHHRSGGGELHEPSKLCAQRAIPRREIERGVEGRDSMETQRQQLIHHPVPDVEAAMQG